MAKNKKDKTKRKEANLRKEEVRKVLAEIGLEPTDDLFMVGVIFNELRVSQRNYFALSNINHACNTYIGLDISIFYQHATRPAMTPACALFQVKDLLGCEYPLITTDISTTTEALNTRSQHIYHYVYDLEFLESYDSDMNVLTSAFRDDRVTLITRCEDYKKVLEAEFYKDVEVIQDFNMRRMLKKIIGDVKCHLVK